ncbi:MAG: class I SAM-dependent RNA methyltransferase [Deltaproteobacteria bacterium]|nr:class I SAM-dependent RNA methyltransferase [Deltaproteobacteria bacterium]
MNGVRSALAVVTPGLEAVLEEELALLGIEGKATEGGVVFKAHPEWVYTANLHSRVAARVLVRLGSARVRNLEALAQLVRVMPWRDYIWPGQPVQVRFSAHQSRLRHRDSAGKKVELAITDALRGPRLPGPRPPRDPAMVLVRLVEDQATLSIDSSGDLLHRRGWRKATAKAPLRENLAAAILFRAGWMPGEPLVDPMCGSGTFAIEAATIAEGLPPGAARGFAFERWPSLDKALWSRVRSARSGRNDLSGALIQATDRDGGAVEATLDNARRAKVGNRVTVRAVAFEELTPPAERGLLVVNPPYGRRIASTGKVYSMLGRALREEWAGWRAAVIVPDKRNRAPLGQGFEELLSFDNGGAPVWVYGRLE